MWCCVEGMDIYSTPLLSQRQSVCWRSSSSPTPASAQISIRWWLTPGYNWPTRTRVHHTSTGREPLGFWNSCFCGNRNNFYKVLTVPLHIYIYFFCLFQGSTLKKLTTQCCCTWRRRWTTSTVRCWAPSSLIVHATLLPSISSSTRKWRDSPKSTG